MKKLFIIVIIIALLGTGCSFNSNTLTLDGDIQNNILATTSTVSGKIIKFNKDQGEQVKKGEIIAEIDNTTYKYSVQQLDAVVKMKRAKLDEVKAGTRAQQIAQSEAQVAAAKAQYDLLKSGNREEQIAQGKNGVKVANEAVNIAKTTYDFSKTQYDNAKKMFNKGALTQNDLDNLKYKVDIAEKQLTTSKIQLENSEDQLALLVKGSASQSVDSAKANYNAAKAQLDLLKSGATAQSITMAQADLDQSIAQLKQSQYNLENCKLKATTDGIITCKNNELGDVVNVGTDVADIAVKNDVYVLCYVPDEYLDKINYGMELNVKTSLGEQKGKVSYINLKHEYTPKDLRSVSDDKHLATKIKVKIDDMDGKLKSGMEATVLVNLK